MNRSTSLSASTSAVLVCLRNQGLALTHNFSFNSPSQGLSGAADDLSNLRSAEPEQYRHQFLDDYDQVSTPTPSVPRAAFDSKEEVITPMNPIFSTLVLTPIKFSF